MVDEYYYNEHDESQVQRILKKKKKKKLKTLIKVFLTLLILIMVSTYFVSDLSKVHSIVVIGNEDVSSEEILKAISVNNNSIHLFVNTDRIAEEVKAMPLIKKASVYKDLFGKVSIEVAEAERVAYCVIGKTTYVIDELGDVVETNDKKLIQSLQSTPKLSQFKDVAFLQKFAKEYVKIPALIKDQTSDIVFSPKKADETRVAFLMNNGKALYVRVEEMAEQLSRFDYEAFMTAYKDRCQFSFEGKNVYMEKCK